MPYVVVDTNIFIRAILKPISSDGEIYKMFLNGKVLLYFSEIMVKEISRVLRYPRIKNKYQLTEETIITFLNTIFGFGKMVNPTERIELCRDPDDNELLSLAASISSSKEVYLLSGDRDLLVLKGKMEKVIIMTPQEFLKSKVHW
ncbi:putative toxin-antitoxin system toxin component, PIN family [Candidatus Gottesmanbacteria bacterium]|nr:putative toxin-antitoxin system toxin component, PIN family [Candidatus Gottesmanbacteria bacterium]